MSSKATENKAWPVSTSAITSRSGQHPPRHSVPPNEVVVERVRKELTRLGGSGAQRGIIDLTRALLRIPS